MINVNYDRYIINNKYSYIYVSCVYILYNILYFRTYILNNLIYLCIFVEYLNMF